MKRQTSADAYYSLTDIGDRQRKVLVTLHKMKYACNLDIANQLGLPINQVTPRTNELVDLGLVNESHRAASPQTGRRVIYWKLSREGLDRFAPQQRLFIQDYKH